jgi:hypothetical protein
LKYQGKSIDLNNDQERRSLNPGSFTYNNYFDGFDESRTLPGVGLDFLPHKANTQVNESSRISRKLTEIKKSKKRSGNKKNK